ncbi:SusD/RagB family nutrient-binding outer membrane lipoprotein [Maribacter sp.]|uniref:SusD/RagB family nutrient-binding outer membrane lipoprotein n=1 Tax=Maribacter sp. TaxID=1897614 RepID=UPI0025BA7016|nr:SusD/RagB family nutrient-binding outer membrane lipoprotein [Maribacter sp.]
MKNIKFIIGILVLTSFWSCADLDEININPNNVRETHPQLLLTNIAVETFEVHGTSPMYASRMLVSSDGESSSQYYNWDRASFDSYKILGEVTKMMEEAERIEAPEYVAIGKFFRAYYFNELASNFGDVPYLEALKGETEAVFNPEYTSQKEVFVGVLKELAEANEILKTNVNFVSGDIIFGGDTSKWRKLINSYRLKILISLSKQSADSDINLAATFASIVANEPIITTANETASLKFFDAEGARYSEFNSSGYGSGMYMASTFVELLKEREDPRLFIFCSQTKNAKEAGLAINDFTGYAGADALRPYGEINTLAADGKLSKVNLRYSTDPTTEPHALLGNWEMEFILAEAAVRGWITTDAEVHYKNGIKASFEFYEMYAKNLGSYVTPVAADTYLAGTMVDFSSATTNDEKLELVVTQKYFTSFLQDGWRMYFDYLRTGFPTFPYTADATPPTRWMYPSSELTENAENVNAAIEKQFGTDNDDIRQVTWWLK